MKRLALLLLLIGCTKPMPPANETQSVVPPATSANGPRVILPDHAAIAVEVVADEELRAQGLMYRDHLDPLAGMLFFFPEEGEYPFWMKNTRIPLDMIWITRDKRVAAIHHDVPPCKTVDCPSYPPNARSMYVLELAAGEAKRHGLKVGDPLRFEGTEHVIAR